MEVTTKGGVVVLLLGVTPLGGQKTEWRLSAKSERSRVRCINTLSGASRLRYVSKTMCIDELDPYEISEWSDDVKRLPPVVFDDISEPRCCRVDGAIDRVLNSLARSFDAVTFSYCLCSQ